MPALLLPILIRYVLPSVLILSALGYGFYKIRDIGVQYERQTWEAKTLAWQRDSEKLIAHKQATIDILRKHFEKELEVIRNAKIESEEKLINDITNLKSRGLFVKSNCAPGGRNTVPSTTKNTSEFASGTSRIRLSGEDESNLVSYASDAQKVVIQYQTLRAAVKESGCFVIQD